MENEGYNRTSFQWVKHLKYVVVIVVVITGSVFFNKIDIYTIKGNSMFKTIEEGDIIIVWKKIKTKRRYHHNEIVLFRAKFQNEILPYVKRVVGIPSDSVKVDSFKLSINSLTFPHDEIFYLLSDNPLLRRREYYQYLKDQSADCSINDVNRYKIKSNLEILNVPNECYFLIGDNPFESMDSRFLGFIHEDQIVGKVVAII